MHITPFAGKTNPAPGVLPDAGAQTQAFVQQARRVHERVAVHHAVARELGVLEPGDEAEHAALLREGEVRLEPHEVVAGTVRVLGTQLQRGPWAMPRARVGEPHRLENAEFARYGVMHRNTFVDAPRLLDESLRLRSPEAERLGVPVHLAGQIAGTEGYCEAIRSGLHVAFAVAAELRGAQAPALPRETAFGALLAYATDPAVKDYQPMHVNFGILPPFEQRIRNKRDRYAAYAARGAEALAAYREALAARGLAPDADGQPEAAS